MIWVGGVAASGASAAVGALLASGGAAVFLALLLGAGRRARERAVEIALADTRTMLQERLSGHVHQLLRAAAAPDRALDARERARLADVVNAAREIEATLDVLSVHSLRGWRTSR
ncbi:MAG: hypothetical protein EA351_06245 [Gemmatimonadales bacterium]|nr:MAG: hypothetical protein EA351_06245 [Gemmatimonadales bacterium]